MFMFYVPFYQSPLHESILDLNVNNKCDFVNLPKWLLLKIINFTYAYRYHIIIWR